MSQPYPKVPLGSPAYPRIQALQAANEWVCDSLDHNDDDAPYCSNPQCFKYHTPDPAWSTFTNNVDTIMNELFPCS